MNLEEKTLEEKSLYEGSFLKLVKQKVLLPDGKTSERDIVRHPGGVAILAFNKDKLLLVEQYRKALDKPLIEIPAGKIEKNEDIKICAIRELEEETGYKAGKIEFLGKFATSPGFCDEYIYLFKAEELSKGVIGGDDDEFINIKEYTLEEVKNMIKTGKLEDCKTIAAMQFL